MTDSMLEKDIFSAIAQMHLRIGLPEGDDIRIQEAAAQLAKLSGVGEVWLWSEQRRPPAGKIRYRAADDHSESCRQFLTARHHPTKAARLAAKAVDPLYQAGMALTNGELDVVIAGAVRTTADVIRAGLHTVGLRPGNSTLSGAFVMSHPQSDRVLILNDCAVVVDPSQEQLLDIGQAALELWQALRPEQPPNVAFLSFSTYGSAEHASVEKVRQAAKLLAERHPSLAIDGELQWDAAWAEDVRQRKAPASPLRGSANIWIFPNLAAGNIAYKIVERLAGFQACGPILLGLQAPFSDLSRGAKSRDIVLSALINGLLSKKLSKVAPNCHPSVL